MDPEPGVAQESKKTTESRTKLWIVPATQRSFQKVRPRYLAKHTKGGKQAHGTWVSSGSVPDSPCVTSRTEVGYRCISQMCKTYPEQIKTVTVGVKY
eukprot:5893041-Amphidinium_carterae.1